MADLILEQSVGFQPSASPGELPGFTHLLGWLSRRSGFNGDRTRAAAGSLPLVYGELFELGLG